MNKMKNFFRKVLAHDKKTAKAARERLQIVVSHQRKDNANLDFLPSLRQDLLAVLCKYFPINAEQVTVNLQEEDKYSLLELNVAIPDLMVKGKNTVSAS